MSALARARSIITPGRLVRLVAAVLLVAAGGAAGHTLLLRTAAAASRPVPQSAAMESALGVRFSRVAVVADGGLITVSYVVLDAEKAQRFQADTTHPPVLNSEARQLSTQRVSLMKQGHTLRAGQTYYLVYQNTRGALRSDELTRINVGSLELGHFPVL